MKKINRVLVLIKNPISILLPENVQPYYRSMNSGIVNEFIGSASGFIVLI